MTKFSRDNCFHCYFQPYRVKKTQVLRMIALSNDVNRFDWPIWRITRGGKSGLHRAVQGVTPLRRKARNSGTERMSRAMILKTGTGVFGGAAGVKTAKLCTKQDQIGKH